MTSRSSTSICTPFSTGKLPAVNALSSITLVFAIGTPSLPVAMTSTVSMFCGCSDGSDGSDSVRSTEPEAMQPCQHRDGRDGHQRESTIADLAPT